MAPLSSQYACPYVCPAWRCTCPQRTVVGSRHQNSDFCLIFGIPSWLMPLRDRSGQRWPPSGMPYVVAATEVCSRFIGACRALSPPPPPFFLCFLDLPFLSLVCPWTIVRSWEHLPFSPPFLSLSLSFLLSFLSSPSSLGVPGCFRHSWEPFLFGVSLDACAVAGNTFASFSPSFSFPPPLPPLSSRAAYLQAK